MTPRRPSIPTTTANTHAHKGKAPPNPPHSPSPGRRVPVIAAGGTCTPAGAPDPGQASAGEAGARVDRPPPSPRDPPAPGNVQAALSPCSSMQPVRPHAEFTPPGGSTAVANHVEWPSRGRSSPGRKGRGGRPSLRTGLQPETNHWQPSDALLVAQQKAGCTPASQLVHVPTARVRRGLAGPLHGLVRPSPPAVHARRQKGRHIQLSWPPPASIRHVLGHVSWRRTQCTHNRAMHHAYRLMPVHACVLVKLVSRVAALPSTVSTYIRGRGIRDMQVTLDRRVRGLSNRPTYSP